MYLQQNEIAERCHALWGEFRSAPVKPILVTLEAENFLPAHVTCNNYRWDYLPEEFELILKLGVWARSEVEKDSDVGLAIAKKFSQKELKRQARRKKGERDGA